MKQIKLLEEIKHPKGNIPVGSILTYDEQSDLYKLTDDKGYTSMSLNTTALNSGFFKFEKL